jgi:dTDP-glucose 4,6-dehydratase
MQTLLITGGAGFIGSALVRLLFGERQVRIVNVDKLTYAGNLDSLQAVLGQAQHVFVHGDICDRKLVDSLLSEFQPNAIMNLAAESHVDRSIEAPATFVQTNVVGTCTLLDAALGYWRSLQEPERGQFRFLQVSTDEVYGTLGPTGCFAEESPFRPNSPYAASKAAADHFVRAYFQTYGLPTLTTHCSNNYGPFQFPEKLIPLIILNALEGKPLPVYGKGEQVRDWLHVEDHCRGLIAALERGQPGEVYDLGGCSERTNLQTVQAVCAVIDELRPDLPHRPCANLIRFVEDRPGHDARYAIDPSKAKGELGWRPRYRLENGLRETVAWYLENRGWVERVSSGVYQRERLGLAR